MSNCTINTLSLPSWNLKELDRRIHSAKSDTWIRSESVLPYAPLFLEGYFKSGMVFNSWAKNTLPGVKGGASLHDSWLPPFETREKRSDFSNCVLIQLLWWRLKTLRTGTRNQFSLCLNFPPRPFSLLLHPYKTHATKRNSRPSKQQRNSVHLAPKPPASTQGGELLPWNPKVKETAITLLFSTSKLTSPPTINLNRVLVFLFD